jgi:quinol monooxygenase YgiN
MAGTPTHAIVVRVTFKPGMVDAASEILHSQVVPSAKATPGFVAGYWLHSEERDHGTSVELFDSQANAQASLDQRSVEMPDEAPLTIDSVEIMEIAASA